MPRRLPGFSAIAAIIVLIAVVVLLRRWIHHAQLELIPVIVPADVPSAQVLAPPASAVATRMLADISEVFSPPKRARYAVLTFDDGPYPVVTPALLRTLTRLNVPANFFLIGRDATEQPAIAQRVASANIEVGNHTLSHPQMNELAFPAQLQEVADGSVAIRHVTGRDTAYFRPPHGDFNAQTIDAARAQRETVALWDVDPGDWRHITSAAITENVLDHAKAPAVILFHNGSAATIDALPSIVQAYRAAGFEFVTLSQLQQRVPLDQINDPIAVRIR